jgi:hypothetical protein
MGDKKVCDKCNSRLELTLRDHIFYIWFVAATTIVIGLTVFKIIGWCGCKLGGF